MMHRVIDISSENTKLRTKHSQLVITQENNEETNIPIEDINIVIINHPSITMSQSVICKLAENKAAVLFCSTNQMPHALSLPLSGNHIHPARLNHQINASQPLNKKLWQSVIKCKINRQGDVLAYFAGHDAGLYAMSRRVLSGDTNNLEAQAAQRYWPKLMGKSFRRHRHGGGANILLNYGYSILRAAVARALCATGLHPALGIHHHNQSNSFALADDMIEVWRPFIDAKVREHFLDFADDTLDTDKKRILMSVLMESVQFEQQLLPMQLAIERMAVSLAKSFEMRKNQLLLPEKITFDKLI